VLPINTQIPGLSLEQNRNLVREVAELAAMAATVAAREATGPQRKASGSSPAPPKLIGSQQARTHDDLEDTAAIAAEAQSHGGGHDAPNWSRRKSAVILLTATLLYAIIAEILVNKVDVVLINVNIDEKFLGITLFALVPNTTEFLVSSTILILGHTIICRND
jgi:Ca2+:H+ antiporter